jgi:hypothetical protein
MKTIFPFMKNKLFATIALMGVFVLGALAADVAGTYTGEIQGGRGPQKVTMVLAVDGATVTGTVSGRGPDPAKIENGKVDGDTITFSTTQSFNGNEMKMTYTGKVKGDGSIEFTREGGRGPSTFTVKK